MRATARQSAYPGTQAVQRAVGLLKAFTPERPALRLPDLSTVAGLNKTTTYRLLSALVLEGLLERAPETGEYRLGPELLALGSRALGPPRCARRAAPSCRPSPTPRARRRRSRCSSAATC